MRRMVELIIAKLRMNRAFGLTGFYYTKKNGEQDYKVIVTKEDKGYYQALKDVEAQLVDNDIVEVVRCRDCEYWDETSPMSTTDPAVCRCRLRRETDATTAEDFCSYGRRKEKTDER